MVELLKTKELGLRSGNPESFDVVFGPVISSSEESPVRSWFAEAEATVAQTEMTELQTVMIHYR